MKKTLITMVLAALAVPMSAQAATPKLSEAISVTIPSSKGWVDVDDYSSGNVAGGQDFTMIAVLDWSDLQECFSTSNGTLAALTLSVDTSATGGRGLSFTEVADGNISLNATTVANAALDHTTRLTAQDLSQYTSTTEGYDKIVVALCITSKKAGGGTLYVYNATANSGAGELVPIDTSKEIYGYSTKSYTSLYMNTTSVKAMDALYLFDQYLSANDVATIAKAAYTAAIPEPATATLSLLALAGLAARRRRK